MHVLVVTIVHHPEDARIRHRQIRALLEAGHTVTYIAPFEECGVPLPDDMTAISVPRAAGRRRLRAITAARTAIRIHGRGADLVLIHDPELLLAIAWASERPPVVWDIHEDTAAALSLKSWLPSVLRPAAVRAVTAVERLAEHRHHLLLAEDAYQARFRKSHPVVPNTTYVPSQVRRPGVDRVVYVGHLAEARGALEMIELGRLLDRAVTVELVGSAAVEVRSELDRAHREGAIVWHGFLPNDEALDLVEGSLAGLSLLHDEPNYRHSRPTKIIEYMARGVPVITTPIPLARDMVEKHHAGIVVPFHDPKAAAEAAERLRIDVELREGSGARGHEAALLLYSWPASAERFVAQLEAWAKTPVSS